MTDDWGSHGSPHNLPHHLTSFIGRERERAEITQRLGETRLLTLTGPGGCGKTRLGLEVAFSLVGDGALAGGVWVVELAALADPALVPQAVALALGAREASGRPLTEVLIDYLGPRSLLLLLDNCEHLVEACAQLVETLLRGCPKLHVLATSREPLRISGEVTWLVPSLRLPSSLSESSFEEIAHAEAVRLFVERAAAVQSNFTLSPQNAAVVTKICHDLDGIPLAIELAAARVNVLSVEQIAERLDDALRLLTGGSRTALPRQQTLQATIEWSYQLLSEPERILFRRLAVFSGKFSLEAVEAVCSADEIKTVDVLDLVSHLVDKSLMLRRERSGQAWYRLLETIRQYSSSLLSAAESASLQQTHARYYLALAEAIAPKLNQPDRRTWLEKLDV